MKKLALLLFLIASSAHAAFMFDTMTGFSTTSDSKTQTDTSDITNHIFLGASIGQKQKTFIGQNVTFFNHQLKQTTTDKISTMELGPRLTYFFTEENVFYVSLAWNPYAKGSRSINGATEDISGFSFLASLGAEVKINKNFHIGGSLNYHTLKISKAISSSNVATTVSDTYASMMPMLNLSFRFR
jgi:hypothetical protein